MDVWLIGDASLLFLFVCWFVLFVLFLVRLEPVMTVMAPPFYWMTCSRPFPDGVKTTRMAETYVERL